MKTPLTSNDIPPGTVIRHKDWPPGSYAVILSVGQKGIVFIAGDGVCLDGIQAHFYEGLMEDYSIWVPGGTGWQPCCTEAPGQ